MSNQRLLLLLVIGGCSAPASDDHVVIIAAADLSPGWPITADDLAAVPMPAALVPRGAVVDPSQLVGRIPFERVLSNEVILEDRLADADIGRGAWVSLDPALRGVAVPGPEDTPVRAGDLVDVACVVDGQTLPLAQQVRVIGVRPPALLLALTFDQAELVAHGLHVGRLVVTRLETQLPRRRSADEWAPDPVFQLERRETPVRERLGLPERPGG